MKYILIKYFATAAVIVLISEFAKRSGKIGALLTALPLIAILAIIWLYLDKQPLQKIGSYSYYTFWYVIPTLPMFLLLPPLLDRIGFWPALATCIALTAGLFFIFALFLRRFGIELM